MKTLVLMLAFPLLLAGGTCAVAQDEKPPEHKVSTSHRGWLGVAVTDLTPRMAKRMKLTTESGALVNDVVEKSPAEKAGIKEKDVIVEFNGKRIADAEDLTNAVQAMAPGTSASVGAIRDGKKETIQVSIGKRSRERGFAFGIPEPPMPPHMLLRHASECYGLSMMELNEQLHEYFGAPDGASVLVEEVEQNSPAAKAGFKAGDIIVKVGGEKVENVSDMMESIGDAEKGDKLSFEVLRKGSSLTLTIVADEEHLGQNEHMFQFQSDCCGKPQGQGFMHWNLRPFREGMKEMQFNLQGLGGRIREQVQELRDRLRHDLRTSEI
jgi:predicted metalloprotease with PDZ domain